MANYIKWGEKTLSGFSDEAIEAAYGQGFVFTRKFKGSMDQTRSLRIDLSKFELSSENRRILRKNEDLHIKINPLPLTDYDFKIHKLAKDFYTEKFGAKTMSASKIKELLTDGEKSNFNKLMVYTNQKEEVGYCISLETKNIIHYSYPFYKLEFDKTGIGIGMMTLAINLAKEEGKQYIYLGSYKDTASKYKLQFGGLEWFDGENWRTDLEDLKSI